LQKKIHKKAFFFEVGFGWKNIWPVFWGLSMEGRKEEGKETRQTIRI